ncbi:GGDEF domain-containing response regulator [Salipaludibacillus daqingensis]|uniref:GGDEF domain-containing response regulator n=1 Tax=Salipaludibacillus daqingensis TaxID=3041001 RepID=UPI00247507C4|nr:diguanylate cyclase [Salipaludibacillus daqingensis]
MMEKYQKMMFDRLEKTIREWQKQKYVYEYELYRFFHSVKGTAGTIDMRELSQEAGRLLFFVDEKSKKKWKDSDWRPYLDRLEAKFEHVYRQNEIMLASEEVAVTSDLLSGEKDIPFILLIDDDVEFVTFMKDFLEENGFQVVIALTGEKGLDLFYSMKPSMIIIDFVLPDIEGISVLAQIIEKARKDFTSVMMVSAHTSDENRTKAYELGAHDFIGKPIKKDVFIPFVKNRMEFRDNILKQVAQDELTGAYNRKFLENELYLQGELLKQGKNNVYSFSMVDLDHFKVINDKYGHQVGDEVLQTFVEKFKETKDPEDSISRYGGEEFAVVFPNTTAEEAVQKISKWRKVFGETRFESDMETFQVNFSAGVKEVCNPNQHRKDIVDQADKALYFAKDSGRNRTSIYEETLAEMKTKSDVTLIIVDDDRVVREMLTHHFSRRQLISGRPIIVKTYSDGISFLEDNWYESDQQYVILLDGMMPKMDGMEVLHKVRQTYGDKNIVISMLTARKGEQEVARALNIGADDYMLKPFNVQEVAARLDRLIERMYSR